MKLNIAFVAAAAALAALTAHALPTFHDSQLVVAQADLKLDGASKLQAVKRGADTELAIRRIDHDGERAEAILARDTGDPKDELLVQRTNPWQRIVGLVQSSDDFKNTQKLKEFTAYHEFLKDIMPRGYRDEDRYPGRELPSDTVARTLGELQKGKHDSRLLSKYPSEDGIKLKKLKAEAKGLQRRIDRAKKFRINAKGFFELEKAEEKLRKLTADQKSLTMQIIDLAANEELRNIELIKKHKAFKENPLAEEAGKGKAYLDGTSPLDGASSERQPLLGAGKNSV